MVRGPGYRQPSNWTATKTRILKRDHGLCYQYAPDVCAVLATTVDHLVPVARGGTHEDANLKAICSSCHELKTESERLAGIALRPRERRAVERHPGLA